MTPTPDKIHQGQNIRRFREMLNIKQETLAQELGPEWTQKKVSLLEGKETIDQELLEEVAKVLKVPVEAITNFNEEKAIHIIANTVNNHDNASGNSVFMYYPTFNPIDKWIEALEENKRLNTELIKAKDEQITLLQKLLDKK